MLAGPVGPPPLQERLRRGEPVIANVLKGLDPTNISTMGSNPEPNPRWEGGTLSSWSAGTRKAPAHYTSTIQAGHWPIQLVSLTRRLTLSPVLQASIVSPTHGVMWWDGGSST